MDRDWYRAQVFDMITMTMAQMTKNEAFAGSRSRLLGLKKIGTKHALAFQDSAEMSSRAR